MRNVFITILSLFLTLSLVGQIKNPDKPLKGRWDFQMKKMWATEKAGDDIIARVQDFGAAADGKIYILDPKNFKIYILNGEGKYISAFGRKGEGPGEIKKLNVGKQLLCWMTAYMLSTWGKFTISRWRGHIKNPLYTRHNYAQGRLLPGIFLSRPLKLSTILAIK